MKKTILLFILLLSIIGVNAQTKKKPSSKSNIINVSGVVFADNPENYINKTIRISDVFYSNAGNIGSWSDVGNLTLRKTSDTFEDLYGLTNYDNRDDTFYCRTITPGGASGPKIKALIPKNSSQNMPNTKGDYIIVTCKVINYETVKVISIARRDNF